MKRIRLLLILMLTFSFSCANAKVNAVGNPLIINGYLVNQTPLSFAFNAGLFVADGEFGTVQFAGVPGAKAGPLYIEMLSNSTLHIVLVDTGSAKCDLAVTDNHGVLTATAQTVAGSDIACQFSGVPNQPGFVLTLMPTAR